MLRLVLQLRHEFHLSNEIARTLIVDHAQPPSADAMAQSSTDTLCQATADAKTKLPHRRKCGVCGWYVADAELGVDGYHVGKASQCPFIGKEDRFYGKHPDHEFDDRKNPTNRIFLDASAMKARARAHKARTAIASPPPAETSNSSARKRSRSAAQGHQ